MMQICGETSDISVVAEAATAFETLDCLRSTAVDVVVLDLNLPDRHGLDLLLQLRSGYPLVGEGERQRHEQLSDREFQVLLLIAAGKPPRDIASELNVSVKTVGAHRAHILQKMGLRNNAEIVHYALTHDLI